MGQQLRNHKRVLTQYLGKLVRQRKVQNGQTKIFKFLRSRGASSAFQKGNMYTADEALGVIEDSKKMVQ